jgi:hypothetical protein
MSDAQHLVSRRTTAVCLTLAPLCEVLEGLLSPLRGTSTSTDLTAVSERQGLFVASVLVGLLGTVLYVPGYLGLAARVAGSSRRLAVAGGALCTLGMLGFAGVRMVSAVQLQAIREPLARGAAVRLVDDLAGNPVTVTVLVMFLGSLVVGAPLLAAACWRAGLPRPAAAWWAVMPVVAFFVDDSHWGNVVTHALLLGSLGWIGWSLSPDMTPRRLLGTRAVVALLVLAPALEVLEQVLSPLSGRSTASDLAGIAARQGAFVASVLVGMVATVLYVPAFLGLASRCLPVARAWARVAAAFAVLSMLGFMGIRTAQSVELQTVRSGVDRAAEARLVDGLSANPVGAVLLVMFLGGSVVGLVSLAVACWRAGLPRPAVALLGAFPVLDLALPTHAGTVVSHAVLLVALAWLATGLAGARNEVRAPVGPSVPQASAG